LREKKGGSRVEIRSACLFGKEGRLPGENTWTFGDGKVQPNGRKPMWGSETPLVSATRGLHDIVKKVLTPEGEDFRQSIKIIRRKGEGKPCKGEA